MRNTYASSNHSDLTADPGLPSNKSHHLHHHSQSESHIKEDSKPRNQHLRLLPQPHLLPAEKSPKTKEKGRRRIITPANNEKPKGTSTKPSTRSKENGIEGWRNSPKTKTNPMNTTMKPSETSTRNHMDFRILMEISDRRRRVMLRFHFPMLTLLGQTPLFPLTP